MNTLTINSKAADILSRAADKARTEKPVVQKTAEYGVYTVLTHNRTKKYTVRCNSATKEITCDCRAFKPCYHIAAVAPIHVYIARQRRDQAAQALAAAEAEAANWPVPVAQSEVPSFDSEEAPASSEAAGAGQDFVSQVQEVRAICAATTARLADYTEEMAARDRSDLFG